MRLACKYFVLLCGILLSITSLFAQPDFSYEPGAWTDLDGQVHEGLILNLRWADIPARISFRTSRDADVQTIEAAGIAALRIGEALRYERHAVQIDIPIETRGRVSTTRNPEWQSDTLLLRVLAEGSASLYVYQQADLVRYFIRTGDGPLEQLIYKRYITPDNLIKENQAFAGQLQIKLACEGALPNDGSLRYTSRYLKSVFQSYYACQGEAARVYSSRHGSLHVHLVPALRVSEIAFSSEIGRKYLPTLGVDAEFLLPVWRRRLALHTEPSYRSFNGSTSGGVVIRYRAVDFVYGLRLYPLSRPGSRFHPYVSAARLISAASARSTIRYGQIQELGLNPGGVFCFSAGLRYGRFGGEVRYYQQQQLRLGFQSTALSTVSISAAYRIF
ncbi:MAG: hypothetical protein NW241_10785 [Bacteroidia bacterium]|nr:hypothetical protein [Bacteroidia bacterium]